MIYFLASHQIQIGISLDFPWEIENLSSKSVKTSPGNCIFLLMFNPSFYTHKYDIYSIYVLHTYTIFLLKIILPHRHDSSPPPPTKT